MPFEARGVWQRKWGNVGGDKDMTLGSFFASLIDDVRIYSRVVRP